MNKHFYLISLFLLTILFFHENVLAQQVNVPFFTVEGEVLKKLKLTREDLNALNQTEIKAKDREGKEHTYTGIPLVEILDSAGVTLGKELRGENLVKYVLIKAVDGYQVIFSLAEVDPELSGQTILLAYEVDGKPLPKGEGPFRIVAPNDKRPARWIRELNSIRIVFAKE